MKTESRHTPRPWIRCDDLGEIKIVGDGVVIARMAYGAFYDSEADANADLVISAPDLLSAAKALIRENPSAASSAWLALRDAIAKAEGFE